MHPHTFVRKEHLTSNLWTFWFDNTSNIEYQAGQFIGLTLHHDSPDSRGEHRWFTLSSSPSESLLGITTRIVTDKPSTFKQTLANLQPGDSALFSKAMGDFVLPMNQKIPLIFVVGGIGITPVRSMLQWLADAKQARHIELLYAVSSRDDVVFEPLLASQATIKFFTGKNKLTTTDVVAAAQSQPRCLVYLSGPEELIEVLVAELRSSPVAASQLVTDYFPGYGHL